MMPATPPTAFLTCAAAALAGYPDRDWSQTPLGPPSGWPPPLRNAVSLMLEARFPMFIGWGPELALLYNAAYLPLIGVRHPAALGMPLAEVWADLWDNVEPLAASALAGNSTFGEDMPRMMLVDGHLRKCWFTLSYSPIRGDDGAVAGVLCVICETTERVRLEARRALQLEVVDELEQLTTIDDVTHAASRLLARHLDAPHVFYADIDDAAGVFEVTRDWTRDARRGLAGYKGRLDDFGPEIIKRVRGGAPLVVGDVFNDARTASFTAAYRTLGVRALLALPLTRAGALSATLNVYDDCERHWSADDLAVASDIAERTWHAVERVRAAAALQRADQRKDEFLAMLAHELRNPLAPIRSAADLLPLVADNPNRIKTMAGTIGRQVKHMARLIDELLDASRVDRGLVTLAAERVDIAAVVGDAVEQAAALYPHRAFDFAVALPPEPAPVTGDHNRLVQIVANLLTNAAKYSDAESPIETVVSRDGGAVRIAVRDRGIGIERDFLPHVFDLFAQGKRHAARTEGGLGLGLSLARTLVELHGGVIAAESEGANRGSTFTIRLPAGAPPAASADVAAPPTPGAPARALRILVVDDNVDAAEGMADYMQAYGHATSVAHDADAALALARARGFDVCLLDIGLPRIDGNELAVRLRALPAMRGALLIAITGYGQPADRAAGQRAGFDRYFIKPVNMAEVLALFGERG